MDCPGCGHEGCSCEERYKLIEELIAKKQEYGLNNEELELLSELID